MSRLGKKPIKLPEGVTVETTDRQVAVRGGKGELTIPLPPGITIDVREQEVLVKRSGDEKLDKSLQGVIVRTLSNGLRGVTEGWEQKLELQGTGYRGRIDGGNLVLAIGYSHPVIITPPEGITFSVAENIITVSGIDHQLVGQVAANIRQIRPPDSYKGKGVRYLGEQVRLKPGKAAVKTTA